MTAGVAGRRAGRAELGEGGVHGRHPQGGGDVAAGARELRADPQLHRAVQHDVRAGHVGRPEQQRAAEQARAARDALAVGQLHVPRARAQQDRHQRAEQAHGGGVPHGAGRAVQEPRERDGRGRPAQQPRHLLDGECSDGA